MRQVRAMRTTGDSALPLKGSEWQFNLRPKRSTGSDSWGDKGSVTIPDSEWQGIAARGGGAIRRWINKQMKRKACVIVLIGSTTAGRPWVNYEIMKGWRDRKEVFGIYIHNLRDSARARSPMGANPFDDFTLGGRRMSDIVCAYNPPFEDSELVYTYIQKHLSSWVVMQLISAGITRRIPIAHLSRGEISI